MKLSNLKEMFSTATPVPPAVAEAKAPAMTRRAKLLRWAGVVRTHPHSLMLYDSLEHWDAERLRTVTTRALDSTAFGLALRDPVLREAGLGNSSHVASVREHMDFFGLTQTQLHEFSCNCGGGISNTEMADRIERLAG